MSRHSVGWQLTSVFSPFHAAFVGRGPGCGGRFIRAQPGRDTHPFHLHSWTKLSHITTSNCHGKWSDYMPRKKRKAWILMSILISEKAEPVLCQQETTMRETISVSFPGSVSGRTATEPYNDTSSSQVSTVSQANQSVTVELLSTVPPFSLSSFQCPKPTLGEGHGKKGLLFLQVRSDKPTLSKNSGVQRKPLSKNSLCKGQ